MENEKGDGLKRPKRRNSELTTQPDARKNYAPVSAGTAIRRLKL